MTFFDYFRQRPQYWDSYDESQENDVTSVHISNENAPSHSAIIYKSELDYMSRCILDYPALETGGQIFGFWTNTGTPVVTYVIGPGHQAVHNPTSFFQDTHYLKEIGTILGRKFGLQHIGEWHSHHQLDLARPSGGDVHSMRGGLESPEFPKMLLCIGNCTPQETEINAFNFHRNTRDRYVHAVWDVLEIESPYRNIVDADLQDILIHPHTKTARHGRTYSRETLLREQRQREEQKAHWLIQDVKNVQTMKEFVSFIQLIRPDDEVKILINKDGTPYISINPGQYEILFPYGFPTKSPVMKKEGKEMTPKFKWDSKFNNLVTDFQAWSMGNEFFNTRDEGSEQNIINNTKPIE